MSSTPAAAVEKRYAIALRNARHRAAAAGDERNADGAALVSLERSLDDLRHYRELRDLLADPAALLAESPYSTGEHSFFGDLANRREDRTAAIRLDDHRDATAGLLAGVEERTPGASSGFGALVPPQYLTALLAPTGRPASPVHDLLAEPLPPTGMALSIARVTTAATAAAQSAELASLGSGDDPAVTDIVAPVCTAWSYTTVSRQVPTRGREGFDTFVGRELVGAVNAKTEAMVLNGAGSGGEPTGLLNTASVGTQTWTDGSPTGAELVRQVATAAATVVTNRGMEPDTVVMHPKRWFWLCSRTEGSSLGEPVGPPRPGSPPAVVGTLLGMDVVTSASMPLVATDQDPVLITRRADLVVQSSPPAVQVAEDHAGSTGGTVRIIIRRFLAVSGERYPNGSVVLSGTGLTTPSF